MSFLENGYELIEEFLSQDQINAMCKEIENTDFPDSTAGIRNANKKYPIIQNISASKYLLDQSSRYLSSPCRLVRAILFNKTPKSNWLVTWHQDKTVAVSKKFEKHQWGPWSIKDHVYHVQPPLAVLNNMITFRIHLDDTNLENGCLKILPKSHDRGILDQNAISEYIQNHKAVVCNAPKGSALVMRPHLLHSSSKATAPSQRRVLHLEYSSFELPKGVDWA